MQRERAIKSIKIRYFIKRTLKYTTSIVLEKRNLRYT